MISLLLMGRRVDMLIQCTAMNRLPVAQIALPTITVKGTMGDFVLRIFVLVPFKQPVGNDATRIALADHIADSCTINIGGVRARTHLEVMRYATGRRIGDLAEGALDVLTKVGLRLEMLRGMSPRMLKHK